MQGQEEQKEKLSAFMDGELIDMMDDNCFESDFIKAVTEDEQLQACWHRYHIAKDAMHGELHNCSLTLDISNAVAKAIASDTRYDLLEQPIQHEVAIPKLAALKADEFWRSFKEIMTRVGQVGLAACVTLAIIAGVQYQQSESTERNTPILNTVPVGVNVAPVGGITQESQSKEQQMFEKRQYDKIRLLVQDYELQKRLNAH